MKKQAEFFAVHNEYTKSTYELITLLYDNLNPSMKGEVAAEINDKFHKVTDLMEDVERLGKEAARELIKEEKNSLVPLAN